MRPGPMDQPERDANSQTGDFHCQAPLDRPTKSGRFRQLKEDPAQQVDQSQGSHGQPGGAETVDIQSADGSRLAGFRDQPGIRGESPPVIPP